MRDATNALSEFDPTTPRKVLVVQPSWVGDAVMATPTLRAIRELYPSAHIGYLMRRYVKPLYAGMPWADQLITYRTGKTKAKAGKGHFFELAARLRTARFDLAILLPNSFKTALVCKMAGIRRVVGYERDGRGFLLTDKLLPVKDRGKFIPSPIIKYYMGLAHYLGSNSRDLRMRLFVTESEAREAREVLGRCGIDPETYRPGSGAGAAHSTELMDSPGSPQAGSPQAGSPQAGSPQAGSPQASSLRAISAHAAPGPAPLILINPGANYGAAKCWLPENFAQLADRFINELGATVLISAAPKERPIVEAVKRFMKHVPVDLSNKGTTLGSLKDIVRRCDLMVTNDTGPRHIAAAFDVPVVTVFGPTHPEWTEIFYPRERQVAVKVFCGPCQKKVCPLDHRCMTRISPGMVFDASVELLGASKTMIEGGTPSAASAAPSAG